MSFTGWARSPGPYLDSSWPGGQIIPCPSHPYRPICRYKLSLCILLKISWGNPYLKIIDLANLFFRMSLWKKKKIVPPPPQSTLKYRSKNRPWGRGLKIKNLFNSNLTLADLVKTKVIFQKFSFIGSHDILHKKN